MHSDGFAAADWIGGATDEASELTAGRAMEVTAAEEFGDSPLSPNRYWMERSWKQGSERSTEAAQHILGRRRSSERRTRRSEGRWRSSERRDTYFKVRTD